MGMVCPWVDNGNLNGYLERYQTTLSLRDRFRIVSTKECFPLHDNGFDALYASFARWPLVYCIVSEMPWVITQMLKCAAVHSFDVVHGDLTGVRILRPFYSHAHCYCSKSNILIDSDGKAFLADFGLSNVVAETHGPLYVTSSIGGSVRWAAPEHFRLSEGSHVSTVTTRGDIYSYGSVTLQVRTIHILF
jgi:serine/threonine protein kinase